MLLHGDLKLTIIEARNLPRPSWRSKVHRDKASISDDDDNNTDDQPCTFQKRSSRGIYVSVDIAGTRVARTQVVPTSQNPTWNQCFNISLAHPISEMELRLKNKNTVRTKKIGVATVPITSVQLGVQWFRVTRHRAKPGSEIKLQMSFIPCQVNPIYQWGIWDDYYVKESYFPLRRGGKLSLYQDAHVMDGMLPEIKLDEGTNYEHQKCWEEIYHAILEAKHLVYIVGWSFNHKIKLVPEGTRELPEKENLMSLGELLIKKSREVDERVRLLLWDDKTSHKLLFRKNGVMKTHDEESRIFFKHSLVSCCLAPRYTNNGFSNFKQQFGRILYAHHQKCVIVDTQDDGGDKRKLTAFIGGLDLCEGRYDTSKHQLSEDDHQNLILDDGPRQPWHDLHCKVEGEAAYDILVNFEQRSQTTECWEDDGLLDRNNISFHSDQDDPQTWHIQVFRSIDSRSLKGFTNNADAAYKQNLVCDKKIVLDRSIERAYIQAIRSAHRFIYIENQYFIGSSYAHPKSKHKNLRGAATNIIPMELALKIANKIRANERFCVYVVIPMWPDGGSISGQEIVRLQRQTMQSMYEVIAQELKSANIVDAQPTHYLNFYCLGTREMNTKKKNLIRRESNSGKLIYVHSKGMIVDDDYVIIGSANINERSMVGSRDTEIAMGAYQPYYLRNFPRGSQVYGYRKSLWAEHMGSIEECFEAPESMGCVAYVNKVAEDNWRRYTADKFIRPLKGHILKYPIQVDIHGNVEALPGFKTFPHHVASHLVDKLITKIPWAARLRNRLVS